MKSYEMFLQLHYKEKPKDGQRLGQRFFNMYCKHKDNSALKDIFYANDMNAAMMIQEWLIDNQFFNNLPEVKGL